MNQPNHNIRCTVETCTHHEPSSHCCKLSSITVGNTNQNAEHAAATECDSFEFAGEFHPDMGGMLGGIFGKNSMDANRTQEDF